VVVLLAEDTRDEAYFWKSRNDEKRMERELRELQSAASDIEAELVEQTDVDDYADGDEASDETAGDGENDGGGGADDAGTPGGSESGHGDDDSGDGNGLARETGGYDAGNGDRPATGQSGLEAFAGDDGAAGNDSGTSSGNGAEGGDAEGGDAGGEGHSDPDGVVAEADPAGETVEVVADQRELDSTIARDLSTRDGIETRLETLAVGDYVLSDRVVVERKTVGDFLDTLTGGDRSMFEQVGDAGRHYARPVVVLEGSDLYGRRNVHPNAIRGALSALVVDFGASVLRTEDADETADLLEVIATREQEDEDREVSVHGEKSAKTLAEQQEYVVASVAEVGPVTARSLLAHFGSVEAVMTAEADALRDVAGVGEVTAERIRDVVGSDYDA